MNEIVVNLPRRVIPRWRDFATTSALGELGTLKNILIEQPITADISEARNIWATFKNPVAAGDLLMAALVERDWSALLESATYLARDDVQAPEFTKDIAKQSLEWAKTQDPFPSVIISATEAPIFKPAIIGSLRRTLAFFPDSPIHWVELALGYAIIGKTEKARRSILTALHLAPDDRFVLRCATRFFLHQGDPEMARLILAKSARTVSDSWLLAAHLSVAAIMDQSPKFYKQAGATFQSQNIAPFHLSELGTALATTEIYSGNNSKAKKLFRQALVQPTENALAQALWANNIIPIEQQTRLLIDLPRSFEANARVLVQAEMWDQAVIAARGWQNDEPFSARPAILGSFLASSVQEDFTRAISISQMGLVANPNEPTLINNLAFAQACLGNTEVAKRIISTVPQSNLTPEQKIVFIATTGLIEFRSGNPIEGKAKYREAIQLAADGNHSDYQIRAAIHLTREELRYDPTSALESAREVAILANEYEDSFIKLALSRLNTDLKNAGISEIILSPKTNKNKSQ